MLHLVIYHVRSAVLQDFLFKRRRCLRRSPLIQGGLQIPIEATVRMEASTKNVEAIERFKRFKQLVEQHYKEPVNGQIEDCTEEVLPGVETESS